jgi:hypothetical protein
MVGLNESPFWHFLFGYISGPASVRGERNLLRIVAVVRIPEGLFQPVWGGH